MDKLNGFWFFVLSFFALFILVSIIRLPALGEWFNLKNEGTLGDAFNGLTAPFISLVSAYLLYNAFMAQNETNNLQIKANKLQQQQFESTTISDTLNRIDSLISNYQYLKFDEDGKLEVAFTGIAAMREGIFLKRPEKAKRVNEIPHIQSVAFVLDRILNIDSIIANSQIPESLKRDYMNHVESYGKALCGMVGTIGSVLVYENVREDPSIKTIEAFTSRFIAYIYG